MTRGALVHSPIVLFRHVRDREHRWLRAFVPVILLAVLTAANAGMISSRTVTASGIDSGVGLFVVVAALVVSAIGTLLIVAGSVFVVSLFHLLATGSGSRKLIECALIAYWVQVPWSLVGLSMIAVLFQPEPGGDVERAIEDVRRMPTVRLAGIIGAYFTAWTSALHAAALRVVSKFYVLTSIVCWIFLSGLFAVLPWWLG